MVDQGLENPSSLLEHSPIKKTWRPTIVRGKTKGYPILLAATVRISFSAERRAF